MKKTKKQKRHEDKHWRTYELLSKPYMKKVNGYLNRKRESRCDIHKFASVVRMLIRQNIKGEFPHGGRSAVSTKGVFISFPERIVSFHKSLTSKR